MKSRFQQKTHYYQEVLGQVRLQSLSVMLPPVAGKKQEIEISTQKTPKQCVS